MGIKRTIKKSTGYDLIPIDMAFEEFIAEKEARNQRISKALGKKVYCIELDTIYDSAKEAANELHLSNHVYEVCNGTRKSCGGYHFKYV